MELLEYQTKSLLQRFHVPSPPHYLIERGVDVKKEVQRLGIDKALIRVQDFESRHEWVSETQQDLIESVASSRWQKVLIIPREEVEKSWTLRISVTPLLEVLVNIRDEETGKVAEERIVDRKLWGFQRSRLIDQVSIPNDDRFPRFLGGVLRAFFQLEVTFLEIVPLVLTTSGLFEVMNARMVLDDAATFRQQEIVHEKRKTADSPIVVLLPGTVACVANGAGLLKATADFVSSAGESLGPLYDIGERVSMEILIETLRKVDGVQGIQNIFVNLFTGIQDGERIAMDLQEEVQRAPFCHRLVIRLEGTNAIGGCRILRGVGQATTTLSEAIHLLQRVGIKNANLG